MTFEIIVVDNGSSDGSVEAIRQTFSSVKVIENSGNRGFVRANNQGIRASHGRYVLSLNNDTVVRNGAFDSLVHFMDEYSDAGACGPKVLNRDGSLQHQCKRGFPSISGALSYFLGLHRIFPKSKVFGHYLMTYLNPDEINHVDSVSGACLMVRREVIEQVGLLDEKFVMYGDDLDLCYRIKKAGWKVYYVPQACIIHYGGQSSRILPYKSILWFYRAALIFYRKHYAKAHSPLVNYSVYGGIWLKALLSLGANLLRKEKIVGSKKP